MLVRRRKLTPAVGGAQRMMFDSSDGGPLAVNIVQWFRAKAAKDRADEAVNKLWAEFRRTCMGYGAYAEVWRAAAMGCEGGERAYAHKTAAMWDHMKKACEVEYDAARKDGKADQVLDHTRVRTLPLAREG